MRKKAKTIAKTPKTKVRATAKKKVVKKVPRAKTAKVAAIPKGYHTVTPYLILDNAAAAIQFYQQAFGAKLGVKIEHSNGRVGHAEMKMGDAKIMLADECPEFNARSAKSFGGSPMNIYLYVKNVDKIVDRAVKAGAKLLRPVENMFYGDRSGCVVDPFGYQWHVSTHVENVSTRAIKKRAAALFK